MSVHFGRLVLGVSVTFVAAACNRVSWPVSRELCGQIQVVDKQTETVLKNTELLLYRSKSKHAPCCSEAERIADMRTDAEGNFSSGKLEAGRYFVVVGNSPQIVFPILLERHYDGERCSLNTMFSFDRRTGKAEQTVTGLVYSR